MPTITPDEQAAINRLKQYNGDGYDPVTNPYGLADTGYLDNGPAAWNDTGTATDLVGRLADVTIVNAQQVAADRQAIEAIIEDGPVISVNGMQGVVTLNATHVGALPLGGGTLSGSLIVNGELTMGNRINMSNYSILSFGRATAYIQPLGIVTSNVTLNFSNACAFSLTLGAASLVINNPTSLIAGQSGVLLINQDASGGRTATFGSMWKFTNGSAPSLSSTPNVTDAVAFFVRSTTEISATFLRGV